MRTDRVFAESKEKGCAIIYASSSSLPLPILYFPPLPPSALSCCFLLPILLLFFPPFFLFFQNTDRDFFAERLARNVKGAQRGAGISSGMSSAKKIHLAREQRASRSFVQLEVEIVGSVECVARSFRRRGGRRRERKRERKETACNGRRVSPRCCPVNLERSSVCCNPNYLAYVSHSRNRQRSPVN